MRNSSFPGDHAVLSKTADYALRAILVLARRGAGRTLSAERIAGLTATPANYLGKTLYALVRGGLLRSARGRSGGFSLAMEPGEITVGRIAAVFGEPPAPRRCLMGTGPCDATSPCPAHRRWSALTAATISPMESTTVADLLADAEPGEAAHPEDRIHLQRQIAGAAGTH
jgi:Rrf2 family protein